MSRSGCPGVPYPDISPRYASLDLWRGLAALLVLVHHAVFLGPASLDDVRNLDPLSSMIVSVGARLWIGVPIFFVISGYCISAAADNHRRHGSALKTYFVRRFRRIFPPYWAVLAATALLVAIADVVVDGGIVRHSSLLRPWWFSPSQWLGSITLTELWRFHIIGGPKGLFLGHAWTLCYEEQFYAVCGALLFISGRRFFAGATAVTLCVLLAAAVGTRVPLPIDGFFFDGAWLQFALGILLYWSLNYGARAHRRLAALVFVAIIGWAGSYGAALLDVQKNAGQQFLVAASFSLAGLWLRPLDRQIYELSVLRPLRSCGLMCYSLYLVHLPVINLMRGGLGAAAIDTRQIPALLSLAIYGAPSLLLAWQFHRLIERRFLNSRPAVTPSISVTSRVLA